MRNISITKSEMTFSQALDLLKNGARVSRAIMNRVVEDIIAFGQAIVEKTKVIKIVHGEKREFNRWIHYPALYLTVGQLNRWGKRPDFTKYPTPPLEHLTKLVKTYNDFEFNQDTPEARRAIQALREEIELYVTHHRLPYPQLKGYGNS